MTSSDNSSRNVSHLLVSRRFLPLFITQFFGALNDNVFKNALLILITFELAKLYDMNAEKMVTIVAAIFILPFFLFSATAGQLSDKYEKSLIIKIIKKVEIVLMIIASIGFYTQSVYVLVITLFLMGTQSAFFGPLKYSIIPTHLKEPELIAGNGLVEAGTFIAILVGTIIGGIFILADSGVFIIATIIIMNALVGWVASLFIPVAKAAEPSIKIRFNFIMESWVIIKQAARKRSVFLAVLGISWFWLVGATFLSLFPTYTKDILNGNEHIVTILLTTFSIGIAIGSILCNKLLNGNIHARFVAIAIVCMSVFMIDFYFASIYFDIKPDQDSVVMFLKDPQFIRILVDLLLFSTVSGVYIVPLYAIMQHHSEEHVRARVVAANNIFNAFFMVVGAIITVQLFYIGLTIPQVFLAVAIVNLGVFFLAKTLIKSESTKEGRHV
ncbi:MAG: MFS transporter [Rickettsiales bacterium]|nr:MFS transporter [Rickettsiales bacterium]